MCKATHQESGVVKKERTVTYRHLFLGDAARLSEADNERRSQRAAAKTSLLTTTADDGVESDSWPTTDVACTDALGAIDLVRGDGHQVNVHGVNVKGDLANSLGGIGVEEDLLGPAELADFLEGLDDTNLVVHSHDTDDGGVGADGSLQLRHVDQAGALHWEIGHFETLVLKMPAAVEDTLVLCLAGDYVLLLAGPAKEPGHTLDAHIVGFGGTAGEDDFLGVSANQISNMFPGLLNGLVCLPAVGMCPRVGVAIDVGEEGHHGIEHSGVDGGCGLHVQVDGALSLVHHGSIAEDILYVSAKRLTARYVLEMVMMMLTSHGADVLARAILRADGEALLLHLPVIQLDSMLGLHVGVVPLGLGHIAPGGRSSLDSSRSGRPRQHTRAAKRGGRGQARCLSQDGRRNVGHGEKKKRRRGDDGEVGDG